MGGAIDFSDTRFISLEEYEQLTARCPIEKGDVLYSAVGSYGTAVPVETDEPFTFQRHIAHIKPNKLVLTRYVVFYLNSVLGLAQAHKVARGVAQKTVTLGELSKFAIGIPPLVEQQEIVRQVNHYFALADQLEARFEQAAALVEQLPQALLAKAFSGQLVPQDPNDEPASALLERLAAEAPAPAKGKRGRAPKAMADAPLFD
jgi:type I restriction enzyme S subunit